MFDRFYVWILQNKPWNVVETIWLVKSSSLTVLFEPHFHDNNCLGYEARTRKIGQTYRISYYNWMQLIVFTLAFTCTQPPGC